MTEFHSLALTKVRLTDSIPVTHCVTHKNSIRIMFLSTLCVFPPSSYLTDNILCGAVVWLSILGGLVACVLFLMTAPTFCEVLI